MGLIPSALLKDPGPLVPTPRLYHQRVRALVLLLIAVIGFQTWCLQRAGESVRRHQDYSRHLLRLAPHQLALAQSQQKQTQTLADLLVWQQRALMERDGESRRAYNQALTTFKSQQDQLITSADHLIQQLQQLQEAP